MRNLQDALRQTYNIDGQEYLLQFQKCQAELVPIQKQQPELLLVYSGRTDLEQGNLPLTDDNLRANKCKTLLIMDAKRKSYFLDSGFKFSPFACTYSSVAKWIEDMLLDVAKPAADQVRRLDQNQAKACLK